MPNINSIDNILYIKDNRYYISSASASFYSFAMYDFCNNYCQLWGKTITSSSTTGQLQPADSTEDSIYVLLNINNQAVYATISTDNGSVSSVYQFSEGCFWVSFVQSLSSSVKVIGFLSTSSQSILKIYSSSSGFTTITFKPNILIYGYTHVSSSSISMIGGNYNTQTYLSRGSIFALPSHLDTFSYATGTLSTSSLSTSSYTSSISTSSLNVLISNLALPTVVSSTISCGSTPYTSYTSFWIDTISKSKVP